MSLQSRLAALIAAIGADIKALQSIAVSDQVGAARFTNFLLTNNSWSTDIPLTNELFDTNAMHDTTVNPERVLIKKSARYVVDCYVRFPYAAGGSRHWDVRLWPGDTSIMSAADNPTLNQPTELQGSRILNLTAGQWLTVRAYQNCGADLNASVVVLEVGALGMRGDKGDKGDAGLGVIVTDHFPSRDAEVKAKGLANLGYGRLQLTAEDGQPGSNMQAGIYVQRDDPDNGLQGLVRAFADPEVGSGVSGRYEKTIISSLGSSDFAEKIPIVSFLPSNPVDGQEVFFQNQLMANNGVVWKLRYREQNPNNTLNTNAHKWECVGGSFLHARDPAAFTLGGPGIITYGNLHTIPLAGWYEVIMAWNSYTAGAAGILQSDLYNASNAVLDSSGEMVLQGYHSAVSSSRMAPSRVALCTVALAAASTMKLGWQSDAASGQHSVRWRTLGIRPIRVA